MSAGTYLAAAAALGVASEATGTTAVTPLGEQAREGGQGGGAPALPRPNPGAGVDLGGIGEAIAAASDRSASISAIESQGSLFGELLSGQQALTADVADTVASQGATGQDLVEMYERGRETAEDTTQGNGPGVDSAADVATSIEQIVDAVTGDTAFDRGGDLSGGSNFDKAKEVVGGTQDIAGDSVGFLTKIGNTGTQTTKALYGEEYSAKDTLAESIHGDATRKIDWSKYQISDAPDLDTQIRDKIPDRVGTSSSSSSSGPTLEEKAWNNVKSKLPGQDDGQDRPEPNSGSNDRKVRAAVEKLQDGDERLIGGL